MSDGDRWHNLGHGLITHTYLRMYAGAVLYTVQLRCLVSSAWHPNMQRLLLRSLRVVANLHWFLLHMTRDFVFLHTAVSPLCRRLRADYLPPKSDPPARIVCCWYWWAGFLSAASFNPSNTYNLRHPTILHRRAREGDR